MELRETTLKVLHIQEPVMEFGNGQISDHPKDGLFLYGPHEGPRSVRHVSAGVVGTEQGINFLTEWADRLSRLVRVPPPGKTEKKNRIHLSDFPGITEVFGISINPDEFVRRPISAKAIEFALNNA